MARQLRIEFPGALYHVFARGNAKQDIFLDADDRTLFLKSLEFCVMTHNLICHAYCLMDNHYHLLLETPDGNLSQGMRDLNGNYAQSFNSRHDRVGHLFQGRYKAIVVEKEVYLCELAKYIANNPVKEGLVKSADEWVWGSHQATIGKTEAPSWLTTDFILGHFSTNRQMALEEYRGFVSSLEGGGDPYNNVRKGAIIGSEQFAFSLWEKFESSEEIKDVVVSERMIGRPSLNDIFSGAGTLKQRDDRIIAAKRRAGYTITEIANHLQLHRTTVSRIYNREQQQCYK